MKSRNLVSLFLVWAFLSIAVTGIFLFLGLKNDVIGSIHVFFGLLFIGFVIVHIKNNFSAIKTYSREKKTLKIRKELTLVSSVAVVCLLVISFGMPFIENFAHSFKFLNILHRKHHREDDEGLYFEEIRTKTLQTGDSLKFIIETNPAVFGPVTAIWTEDANGHFIDNLFLPAKVLVVPPSIDDLNDLFRHGERNTLQYADLNTKLLPVFSHQAANFKYNYPKATPVGSFFLDTKTKASGIYAVCLETSYHGKSELYTAQINPLVSHIFTLSSAKGDLLKKAIVEISN